MVDHCKESADQRSARIEARLAEAERERDEAKAQAIALFWRLPDETISGQIRAEASIAFHALRKHAMEQATADSADGGV